jgi:hypothetical protein
LARQYRITIAQLAFVLHYIDQQCQNATQAYALSHPGSTSENAHGVGGHQALNDPKIIAAMDQELQRAFNRANVTADNVLAGLAHEARTAQKAADRIRAYEILGRYLSLWSERPQLQSVTFNLELGAAPAAGVLEPFAAGQVITADPGAVAAVADG